MFLTDILRLFIGIGSCMVVKPSHYPQIPQTPGSGGGGGGEGKNVSID